MFGNQKTQTTYEMEQNEIYGREENEFFKWEFIIAPIVLTVAFGFFMAHSWISGIGIGIAFAFLFNGIYGIPKRLRGKTDPLTGMIAQKRRYRPTWLRIIAWLFSLHSLFIWTLMMKENTIVGWTGIGLFIAITYYMGFGNWRKWFRYIAEWRENHRPKTKGEKLLEKFDEKTLYAAGLFARDPDGIKADVLPKVLKKYTDENDSAIAEVEIVRGRQTFETYKVLKENLASAWGVPFVQIQQGAPTEDGSHTVIIKAMSKETAIDGPVMWEPLDPTGKSIVEYTKALPMGKFMDTGKEYHINLVERNFMMGGMPGSGKSSFANALLGQLVRHPDVRVMVIDLKSGAESASWEDAVSGTIDNSNGSYEKVLEFLKKANANMNKTYLEMRKEKVTNAWTEGFLGPEHPVKILVVDEISDLFRSGTREERNLSNQMLTELQNFVQKGRAAGYVLLVSTQNPVHKNLPTEIKRNISDSIAFQVRDEGGTSAMFGSQFIPDSKMEDPVYNITGQGEAVIRNGDFGEGRRIKIGYLTPEEKSKVIAESAIAGTHWLDDDLDEFLEKLAEEQAKEEAEKAKAEGRNLEKPKREKPAQYPVPKKQVFKKTWDDFDD